MVVSKEEKKNFKEMYKAGYDYGKKQTRTSLSDNLYLVEQILKRENIKQPSSLGQARALLNSTLDICSKYGYNSIAIDAALLYEKIGLGKSFSYVKKKLIEANDKNLSLGHNVNPYFDEKFKDFLKRNSDNSSNLEGKVISSIFGICALAGIYFGISGMTGAAIGLTKASSSFLGVLLFVGGIAGLFFSLKK
ncbi:MAG: hypothetical protein WC812_00705 [Candidatus Pacearchaeota archaeon]|jgi:hypothetical protein